jgi:hypothetical protein
MRGYFDSIAGRVSVLKPTRLACAHLMVCSVCNKDSRLLFAVFPALSLHKKNTFFHDACALFCN